MYKRLSFDQLGIYDIFKEIIIAADSDKNIIYTNPSAKAAFIPPKLQTVLRKLISSESNLGYIKTHGELYKFTSSSFTDKSGKSGTLYTLRISSLFTNEFQSEQTISALAHDFRIPLSSIQSICDFMVLKHRANFEIRDMLQAIKSASLKLTKISDRIIDYSKLQTFSSNAVFHEINVYPLIKNILADFKAVTTKEISINFQSSSDCVYAVCNEEMLARAMINLISNAIKFTPEKGAVTVVASQKNHRTIILIKDDGPGIPAEIKDNLFNFHYKHPGISIDFNYNMGLLIAKYFINLNKGQLRISTPVCGGTVAIIRLTNPEPNSLPNISNLSSTNSTYASLRRTIEAEFS